jgi:hypothetical protein
VAASSSSSEAGSGGTAASPPTPTATTGPPKANTQSVNLYNSSSSTTEINDAVSIDKTAINGEDDGGENQQQPPAVSETVSGEPLLADLSRGAKVLRSGLPSSQPTTTQSSSAVARQSSPTAGSGRSADDVAWERSRISVRVRTTPGPPLAAVTRGSRRDDADSGDSDERSSTSASAAGQPQRGRVRLNSSVLGSYQKGSLSPLAAVRGEGISSSSSGVARSGVGASAAALRAERVRFKVR